MFNFFICAIVILHSPLFVGTAPKLLTLLGGKFLFKDKLTMLNMIGFAVCQIALAMFFHERKHMRNRRSEDVLPE